MKHHCGRVTTWYLDFGPQAHDKDFDKIKTEKVGSSEEILSVVKKHEPFLKRRASLALTNNLEDIKMMLSGNKPKPVPPPKPSNLKLVRAQTTLSNDEDGRSETRSSSVLSKSEVKTRTGTVKKAVHMYNSMESRVIAENQMKRNFKLTG